MSDYYTNLREGREENFVPPPSRADLKWLALDFDGTLAESTWSIDNPTALPGRPKWGNVAKLNAAVALGKKIQIHTSRPSSDYELLEAWFLYYGIHFDGIVTGKVLVQAYVDDRAVHESAEDYTNGGHCATCRCGH